MKILRFGKDGNGTIALKHSGANRRARKHQPDHSPMLGFEDVLDHCPSCGSVSVRCAEVWRNEAAATLGDALAYVPSVDQLREWLSPPAKPELRRSKWHQQATQEALALTVAPMVALSATGLILGGGYIPYFWYAVFAAISIAIGARAFVSNMKKAAAEDAKYRAKYEKRLQGWKDRVAIYHRLHFCPKCAIVHDSKTERQAPWYGLLDLLVDAPSQGGPGRVDKVA